MLIRITDYCTMSCTHCLVNANEHGRHMDTKTFEDALKFSLEYDPSLIISGGEPTQHPHFLEMLAMTRNFDFIDNMILILSNGVFLEDGDYTKKILDFDFGIQITNDPRYYPKRIKKIEHPRIEYIDKTPSISPFGRALDNKIPATRYAPLCYNLRSIAYSIEPFFEVVRCLRTKANKFCTPSINTDGSVSAGETPFCERIGTIYSTDKELMHNIRTMHCNKCGLHKNLEGKYAEQWKEMNDEN